MKYSTTGRTKIQASQSTDTRLRTIMDKLQKAATNPRKVPTRFR